MFFKRNLPKQVGAYAGYEIILCFHITSVEFFKACLHTQMLSFLCPTHSDPIQQPMVAFVTTWDFQSDHVVTSQQNWSNLYTWNKSKWTFIKSRVQNAFENAATIWLVVYKIKQFEKKKSLLTGLRSQPPGSTTILLFLL